MKCKVSSYLGADGLKVFAVEARFSQMKRRITMDVAHDAMRLVASKSNGEILGA